MKKISTILAVLAMLAFNTNAAPLKADSTALPFLPRYYFSNTVEGAIFSSALLSHPISGNDNKLSTLRFSLFFNTCVLFHYNFSRSVGFYTGLELKNMGFIEKSGDYTYKRRTYSLGIPLALKVGDMTHRGACFFVGTGVDAPFNYREKKFIARNNKSKFNEWFSDRTPAVMPYVFAGYKFKSQLNLKLQYYPGNYLNPDFETGGLKPYENDKVQLMYFTVGYTFRFKNQTHWKGKWVQRGMK